MSCFGKFISKVCRWKLGDNNKRRLVKPSRSYQVVCNLFQWYAVRSGRYPGNAMIPGTKLARVKRQTSSRPIPVVSASVVRSVCGLMGSRISLMGIAKDTHTAHFVSRCIFAFIICSTQKRLLLLLIITICQLLKSLIASVPR